MEFLKSETSIICASPKTPNLLTYRKTPRPKQQDETRIINGLQVSRLYARFLTIQKSYCLSLIINSMLSGFYYELDYMGKQYYSKYVLRSLICAQFLSTILSLFSIKSYNQFKQVQKKSEEYAEYSTLLLHWGTILLQPYQFLQDIRVSNWDYHDGISVPYKVNYLLVILCLFKYCIIVPSFMKTLKFKSPRASRVSHLHGCLNSKIFLLKCYFKQSPITLVSSMFFITILIFSFAYRVGQRNPLADLNNFQHFGSCVWLVVITITSVGFGDVYPVTAIGRSIGYICTFCGVLTVSIIIVVVTNTFKMENGEMRSLMILKKLQKKKQIKIVAGNYIREALWRVWKNYKLRKKSQWKHFYKFQDFQIKPNQKKYRHLFVVQKRENRLLNMVDQDIGFQMSRQFLDISSAIRNLQKNSDSILEYISQNFLIDQKDIDQNIQSKKNAKVCFA